MRTVLRLGVAALVLATAMPVGVVSGAGGAAAVAGQQDDVDPKPVGIVVLVDESGSLGDDGVRAERAAASVIVQSEFSANSRVAVVGFAGRNKVSNASPVRVVCQPTTVAGGPDRDYLSQCVEDLRPRTREEGDDTDFPSALNQGLSLLGEMSGVSAKLLFLLTDGELDVSEDSAYGSDPAAREQAARGEISRYLAQARDMDVQVWPLGFGEAVQSELDAFAAGGSQRTCSATSARPRARIATDTASVIESLADAYASARCGAVGTAEDTLPAGGSVELTLDVPAIATDGSIAVHKRLPAVSVAYLDPDGNEVPKNGRSGDSAFQVSGESSQVEVLRVRNPAPGRWTVRLTAPPGQGSETVSALVIWQGAVRSSISVSPVTPRRGESATVDLTLRTRKGALAEPEALRDITAAATLTGDGFGDVPVTLAAGADGRFTGKVTIPSTAKGSLRLVGAVGGPGIAPDERPWVGEVNLGGADVRAQVRFDSRRVEPGATLDGTVVVANDTGDEHAVLLRLVEVDTNTVVRVSPSAGTIDASGSTSIPFKLTFGGDTKLGHGAARLLVVDRANPDTVYGEAQLTFEVGYPPTLWERLRLLLLVAAGVLLLAAAALWLRLVRRRGDLDVRGLRVLLYRNGRQLGFLDAPNDPNTRFRFVVRDEYGVPSRLDHAAGSEEAYVVRRTETGAVVVRGPYGEESVLRPGDRTSGPSGDLELSIADTRVRSGRDRSRRGRHAREDDEPAIEDAALHTGPVHQTPPDDLL